jgi:hypothetical protein
MDFYRLLKIDMADPGCCAIKVAGLRPLGCWHRGFESY